MLLVYGTVCTGRRCARGHDHTASFGRAGNLLYSEAPKGRGAPHVMDQALALTDLGGGGLMREWLVKVRSLKLRYQFFSFRHPQLDQTESACLFSVFCLRWISHPGLPYFATWRFLVKSLWVHVYRSLAVFFISLSLYTHHSVWVPMSDSASQQSSRQWPGPAVSPPHRQSEACHLLEGPVVSEQI